MRGNTSGGTVRKLVPEFLHDCRVAALVSSLSTLAGADTLVMIWTDQTRRAANRSAAAIQQLDSPVVDYVIHPAADPTLATRRLWTVASPHLLGHDGINKGS
jgi:hypothetical protein